MISIGSEVLQIVLIPLVVVLVFCMGFVIFLLIKLKNSHQREFSEFIIKLEKISENQSVISKSLFDELSRNRAELLSNIHTTLKTLSATELDQMKVFSENLHQLTQLTQKNLFAINDTLRNEIRHLQEQNELKLEEMRKTVDERLHATLEHRLSTSFKTVSEQLESVYRGLGEMKSLASDVGDLKRVLTNVKQRGIFGELQLEAILEDILAPQQYEKNVKIKRDTTVEFVVKIPSKDDENKYLLLPIDSKFPREDYDLILSAQEKADSTLLKEALRSLSNRILTEARDIQQKYIDPPKTTDFAILFLPVEGLFAEVLRIPGLFERIRKEHNVIITGPTTITAILNSLQMGFRTLAIEKKSQEVWKILGAVKTEFHKFNELLVKTREKLESVATELERAHKRTQMIDKKLRGVEQLDYQESRTILELDKGEIMELDS